MAWNEMTTTASPQTVFAILSEPHAYSDWVVGAKRVRCYDPEWPAVGTAFHHTIGFGPIAIRDKTTVKSVDPPQGIVLLARAMPAGVAEVRVDISPDGRGSRVTMTEEPLTGLVTAVYTPLLDLIVRARNAESLRRLKVIAEGRARAPAMDG